MASDLMYDLAFRYKNTKLWQRLYDDEMFAVALPDGEIGYCSVMGALGDHIALGLYVGKRGYQTYRQLLDQEPGSDSLTMGDLLTCQDCLQCSFEQKEMLTDEELEEARAYAKKQEKSLRGKNAFPQFTKYRPGRYPWHFDGKADEERICAALSAGIALKTMLHGKTKGELGLRSLREEPDEIPLMTETEQGWVIRLTALPEATVEYPECPFENDLLAARIKKRKKRGTLDCGTVYLLTPVRDEGEPEEAPHFPLALISLNRESGALLPPVVGNGERTEAFANGFAENLLKTKTVPELLRVRDERCFAMLSDLCRKTGIRLELSDELEELYEAMSQMEEEAAEVTGEEDAQEQLQELCEGLELMSDGELKQMPREMAEMLLDLAEQGLVPEALTKRLKRLFKR